MGENGVRDPRALRKEELRVSVLDIRPMPDWCRDLPPKYRIGHPPLFGSEPTREDYRLAIALIERFDADSQVWYRLALLREELAALPDDDA